ncbi:hypothetical protein SO802_027951 [Lithocarpus litseifolius]|uniref:FAD-binding domain-containing protein n=1 Tax=Lithocarpus litseifolius TaxID=425828 RepID=A0AAW2BR76_9ROSI
MEAVPEDIVIVGAGVAGLATSLGLHRYLLTLFVYVGYSKLVLESSENLRSAGYCLTTFTNAWKALDALGVGDSIRQQHERLRRPHVVQTTPYDKLSRFKEKRGIAYSA